MLLDRHDVCVGQTVQHVPCEIVPGDVVGGSYTATRNLIPSFGV
jgi:hypothetical protein